jgi:hypothetical protein
MIGTLLSFSAMAVSIRELSATLGIMEIAVTLRRPRTGVHTLVTIPELHRNGCALRSAFASRSGQ